MEVLSEYIVAAFVASLVAGIGEKLAPSSMKRYVGLIAALLLLIFLFSPIKALGEELFKFADSSLTIDDNVSQEESSHDVLLKMAEEKAEQSVKKHLVEQFGLNEELSVSLTLKLENDDTVLLTGITVDLPNAFAEQMPSIESYLEEVFHTQTTVNVMAAGD